MEQSQAFLEESQDLDRLIAPLGEADWIRKTAFKQWTIEVILRHLHLWNKMALAALEAPEDLKKMLVPVLEGFQRGDTLVDIEPQLVSERGGDLLRLWRETYQTVADAYSKADPAQRCPWVGPSMSARSCITARQMETWAHGQAIYDELGRVRENTDRLRNVVILGINTYDWTFQVRGEEAPQPKSYVELMAPSGDEWCFGDSDATSRISGSAEAFAQVVTQTRHVEDTDIRYSGESARRWVYNAQCFAGGASPPPAPGTRSVRQI